jgi:hypothetical protein
MNMERKQELALVEPENGNALSITVQQKEQLKNAAALAQDNGEDREGQRPLPSGSATRSASMCPSKAGSPSPE